MGEICIAKIGTFALRPADQLFSGSKMATGTPKMAAGSIFVPLVSEGRVRKRCAQPFQLFRQRFCALPSLTKGAKTLPAAISGVPAAIFDPLNS